MTIKWEDPPKGTKGAARSNRIEILKEVQANPGKWAMIAEGHKAISNYIGTGAKASYGRGGAYTAIDIPNFEWTTSKTADGTNSYARYNTPTQGETT